MIVILLRLDFASSPSNTEKQSCREASLQNLTGFAMVWLDVPPTSVLECKCRTCAHAKYMVKASSQCPHMHVKNARVRKSDLFEKIAACQPVRIESTLGSLCR